MGGIALEQQYRKIRVLVAKEACTSTWERLTFMNLFAKIWSKLYFFGPDTACVEEGGS